MAAMRSHWVISAQYSDVYVTNLAIADFIFVATMPFWAVDLIEDEWK